MCSWSVPPEASTNSGTSDEYTVPDTTATRTSRMSVHAWERALSSPEYLSPSGP
ncbi:hypothetical protein EES42_24930 [Streptomyces sp. ADI95-17]|nr:hypothetical protein EES42_24930 [Streptomyces sp. ADI95-17]